MSWWRGLDPENRKYLSEVQTKFLAARSPGRREHWRYVLKMLWMCYNTDQPEGM